MKNFIYNLIAKYFHEQIEDAFIEQELSQYNIKLSDKGTSEKISDLATSPEYRILVGLLSNKKNSLGKELLKKKFKNRDEATVLQAFYHGQAYFASSLIALIKYINRQHKNGEKHGKKKN